MLRYVKKLGYILLLIVTITSCRWELSPKQLRQMREDAFQVSMNVVGSDNYWAVYNAMNDSVKVWAEHELWFYKYFNRNSIDYGVNYQIDSLLCFNTQQDICFTAILRQMTGKDENSDDIWVFIGIKINEQWYFSSGATLILPRDFYQKDEHTPLSLEKLKELAMKHLYQRYVYKSKNGEWAINNAFFSRYYKYDAYNNPVTSKAERDSSWLKLCRENWSERNKR